MSDRTYCYPGTNLLKNIPGITDPQELFWAEAEFTSERLLELQKQPMKGRFDFRHLYNIHKYIFQDIYSWAGKPRTVNIGKGNLFCLPEHIQSFSDDVFRNFAKDCYAAKDDKDQFISMLAEHYGDMNALHPFREGNGRAQREFTRELCEHCGYDFDLSCTTHQEMLEASIASFNDGDSSLLEGIFHRVVGSLPPDGAGAGNRNAEMEVTIWET